MFRHTHICVCACLCVCVGVSVCVYTYTHTYVNILKKNGIRATYSQHLATRLT